MGTIRDVSYPLEPCSGTVSRLRNLYPRSTQNTDAVFSINFSNPSVSCLLHFYLKQSISILFRLLERYGDSNNVNDVNNNNVRKITV